MVNLIKLPEAIILRDNICQIMADQKTDEILNPLQVTIKTESLHFKYLKVQHILS